MWLLELNQPHKVELMTVNISTHNPISGVEMIQGISLGSILQILPEESRDCEILPDGEWG